MNFNLFIIGENCSLMKAVANKIGVPLFGCASHRFNLAVQSYLDLNYELIILKVKDLMKKLNTLKEKGKLRKKPLFPNFIQWNQMFGKVQYDKKVLWFEKFSGYDWCRNCWIYSNFPGKFSII